MVVQVPQGPSSFEEDAFEDSFDHFMEPGPLWSLDDVWGIWTGSESQSMEFLLSNLLILKHKSLNNQEIFFRRNKTKLHPAQGTCRFALI